MRNDRPTYESENDGTLLGRVSNGDADAVSVLIVRYQQSLLNFLKRACPTCADDLFQECWIRVVRSAHRFDPSYPFSSWLFKIAWNQVKTEWSRREGNILREKAPSAPFFEPLVEEQMVQREQAVRLRALISELPPRLAEAVMLRFFEELTEKQMAERLGVPAGTVKSRLHHALKKLGLLLVEEDL